jgi:hypothetical protein
MAHQVSCCRNKRDRKDEECDEAVALSAASFCNNCPLKVKQSDMKIRKYSISRDG